MPETSTVKVCLVTGGGRGIGAAVAREMHARGYRLALLSPSESCETLAAAPTPAEAGITAKGLRVTKRLSDEQGRAAEALIVAAGRAFTQQ